MTESPVKLQFDGPLATITLNDPDKRNALGITMFDAIDDALGKVQANEGCRLLLLAGAGKVFCAGFDLASAIQQPDLMGQFIMRLSNLNRTLRRLPPIVICVVHGSAIAGGCAILSACDFVFIEAGATVGYPVHRLGVSPAVTIATLAPAIGSGAARSLLMGGELIAGIQAHRLGLATHLVSPGENVMQSAETFAQKLLRKPPEAQRITKAWLNELDGSLDDDLFDDPARHSAELAQGDEARNLLKAFWESR